MVIVFGTLTNEFGGFTSQGDSTSSGIALAAAFHSVVVSSALKFVYIGIGVFASSFLGTLCWTLSGERISRRIRA
jgi:hypothetical protein